MTRPVQSWILLFIGAFIFATVGAHAQSVTLAGSAATVRPGQQVTLSVGVSGSPAAAAFQFRADVPSGWTYGPTAIASAGTAANKTVQCGVALSGRLCVVYGANNNTLIAAGPVVTIPITVPASAAPGPYQLALSGILAGSANASPVTLGSPAGITVTVLSPFDLNGDGTVNSTDLQATLDQVVGTAACSTGDFNGDGKCDVIDTLLLIVKGIMGL